MGVGFSRAWFFHHERSTKYVVVCVDVLVLLWAHWRSGEHGEYAAEANGVRWSDVRRKEGGGERKKEV